MKYLKMVIFCLSLVLSSCFLSRPSGLPAQITMKDAFGNTSIHYFLDKDDDSTQRGVRFIANQEFTVYVPLYGVKTLGMLKVKFDDNILTRFNTTVYMNISVLKKSGTLKEYPVVEFSPKTLETIKGKLTNVAELLNVTSGKSVHKSKKKNIKKTLQYGVDALSQLELEQDDAIIVRVSRSIIDNEAQEKEIITPFPEKGFEDFTISSAEKPPIEEPISIITRLFKNITLQFLIVEARHTSGTNYEPTKTISGMLMEDKGNTNVRKKDLLMAETKLRYYDGSSSGEIMIMYIDFTNSVIDWGTDFDSLTFSVDAVADLADGPSSSYSFAIIQTTKTKKYSLWLENDFFTNPITPSVDANHGDVLIISLEGLHKPTGQLVKHTFNGASGVKHSYYWGE